MCFYYWLLLINPYIFFQDRMNFSIALHGLINIIIIIGSFALHLRWEAKIQDVEGG